MKTAYLVGFINITTSPPVMEYARIQTSAAGSTAINFKKVHPVDLFESGGETYEEAHQKLLSLVEEYYPWLKSLLK